jgi:hypothetical protein
MVIFMPAPKGNKFAKGHGEGCPQKYTDKWIEQEAEALLQWMKKEDSVYFKSFAVERGYSPQRLTEFAKSNKVFSEALELAKSWQECRLVNYSLWNKINSNITKFCLANCHGFSDKTELSGNAANPLGFLMQMVDGASKDLIHDED